MRGVSITWPSRSSNGYRDTRSEFNIGNCAYRPARHWHRAGMTPICITGCSGPWGERIVSVIVLAALLFMAYCVVRIIVDWLKRRRERE